jgi:hypothetical protein
LITAQSESVHRQFLRGFGLSVMQPQQASVPTEAEEGLELF